MSEWKKKINTHVASINQLTSTSVLTTHPHESSKKH